MLSHTRRGFLKAALAASAAPVWVPSAAFGANERLALAVVGAGGRGRHLARQFAKLDEARVVAACDVDARARTTCVTEMHKAYGDAGCAGYADFREVIARPDIDGVVIA
ncbi:MAG: gfo/Idh/MocA family oxidoreductase, partial [Kiritimatiellia bacterium]